MDNFQASHIKFTPYLPKIFGCHVQIWGLPKSKFRQAGNASRSVSLGFGNSGSDNGDRRGGDSGVIITATGT